MSAFEFYRKISSSPSTYFMRIYYGFLQANQIYPDVKREVIHLEFFACFIAFASSQTSEKTEWRNTMSTLQKSIDVNAPVNSVYNQWTQFEEFPAFMEGVKEVRQLDDSHLHWCAEIAGKDVEWDAEITEQIPDQRIAWRSLGGSQNAGVVSFHKLNDGSTRVMLQMDYDPEGMMENAGDAVGLISHRIENDLECFKDFLESRGSETGGWRGTISPSGSR